MSIFTQCKNEFTERVILFVNSQSLTEENCIRYLGVYIDSISSWKSHINYITKKIKRNIGVLYNSLLFPEHKNVPTLVLYLSRVILQLLGVMHISNFATFIYISKESCKNNHLLQFHGTLNSFI